MFDIWIPFCFYLPRAAQSDVPSDSSGITLTLPDLNAIWAKYNGAGWIKDLTDQASGLMQTGPPALNSEQKKTIVCVSCDLRNWAEDRYCL